jgi:hypothetical protein
MRTCHGCGEAPPHEILDRVALALCLSEEMDCVHRGARPGTCGTCAGLARIAMVALGHEVPSIEEIYG